MSAQGWTHPLHAAVADLVTARTGLALPARRRDVIETGIRRAMHRSGAVDPVDYLARLRCGGPPLDELIDELTVRETFFFRDHAQFQFIRDMVLPDLRRRHDAAHVTSAWSAGCASGEEAYSLAILFEQEGIAARSRILATDISRAALAKAREACYGAWSLRGWPGAALDDYFLCDGARYRLAERLRERVILDHLNLALDRYPGRRAGVPAMDLILCRNVLIYMEPAAISVIARGLFDALADGGFLMPGASDPLLSHHAPFEIMLTPAGVVYRRPAGSDARAAAIDHAIASTQDSEPAAPAPNAAADAAHAAFRRGDYAMAVALAGRLDDDDARELRIRALANGGDVAGAEALAADAARGALTAGHHLLHASLLMALRRDADAAGAARRALYLDRTLAVAHLVLGTILCRLGDLRQARLAYRNCHALASLRPADEPLPLSGGEPAGRLAQAAAAQLALLASGTP